MKTKFVAILKDRQYNNGEPIVVFCDKDYTKFENIYKESKEKITVLEKEDKWWFFNKKELIFWFVSTVPNEDE
jgi:uncharacterized protein YneR